MMGSLGAIAIICGVLMLSEKVPFTWGKSVGRLFRNEAAKRRHRHRLAGLWASVGVYLAAGYSFWSALDVVQSEEPTLADAIRDLAEALETSEPVPEVVRRFHAAYPGPESQLIATMTAHGYRHGLGAQDVAEQALDMFHTLAYERQLAGRQTPLWLSVLPGVLLLNLLLLFAIPTFLGFMGSLSGGAL